MFCSPLNKYAYETNLPLLNWQMSSTCLAMLILKLSAYLKQTLLTIKIVFMKQQLKIRNTSRNFRVPITAMAIGFILSITFIKDANAQFVPTTLPQTLYPTTGTTALNLDKVDTKYLSNFSFAGAGSLSGQIIEISGWSTDNDGGFSYGRALASTPFTYTGDGAVAIPNARDVQVGFMVNGGLDYIVASYYDVSTQQYGYDLYSYLFTAPSTVVVTKLYTYHFQNPDYLLPEHVATSHYVPSYPFSLPRNLTSTMNYNRISMDINNYGDKVAMVMTDNSNGYLYLATGIISTDTIIFSPNLPAPGNGYPVAVSSGGTETIINHYPYPGSSPWTLDASGVFYYFTDADGCNVRYYVSGTYAGEYHYSYYPLDLFVYATVTDGTGAVLRKSTGTYGVYNPLIGIKGSSYVTGPGATNAYFNYYWPDVCFHGADMRIVFYVNNPNSGTSTPDLNNFGAEDLYVTTPMNFTDYYTYTGQGLYGDPSLGYKYAGPNHIEAACVNTFDGRPLRATPTTLLSGMYNYESQCESLPLVSGEEIRAKIDAPAEGGGDCAITFAYSGVPALGYDVTYNNASGGTIISYNVHNLLEFGKKNIYLRYTFNDAQAILTNNSLITGSHTPINDLKNINPTVAFEPSSTKNVAVAWVSEQAKVTTAWSYVSVKLDLSAPVGSSSPLFRLNPDSYLRIPNTPSLTNDCGNNPLVALSRGNFGLNALYCSFSQEDGTPTYSIQHQNHNWSVSSLWKKTGIANLDNPNISVGPNPFTNTLHIQGVEECSVQLSDILGRKLFEFRGEIDAVNKQLDNKVSIITPGTYLLNITTKSGDKETFKLTKQ